MAERHTVSTQPIIPRPGDPVLYTTAKAFNRKQRNILDEESRIYAKKLRLIEDKFFEEICKEEVPWDQLYQKYLVLWNRVCDDIEKKAKYVRPIRTYFSDHFYIFNETIENRERKLQQEASGYQ